MNYFYDPKEQDRLLAARESFSGRLLTNAQFDEAMAVTGIIEREIQKTGAFRKSSATMPMPSPAPRSSTR